MRKIAIADIKTLQEYELARPDFRREVIEIKKRRRVALGPLVTLLFENRQTALFQMQEMIRAERIVDRRKVQEEIDVYNTMLPDPGEVSATLFIEVTEEGQVKAVLDSFIGLDEGKSLWLETSGREFFARFETGHGREDKISAVHYLRFPLGEEGRRLLEQTRAASLRLDHRSHRARTELGPEVVGELLKDLGD